MMLVYINEYVSYSIKTHERVVRMIRYCKHNLFTLTRPYVHLVLNLNDIIHAIRFDRKLHHT